MVNSARCSSLGRIVVDMNTQCDFLLPNGALPVANRSEVIPNIRRIMNWVRIQRIPVISSLECHRPGETFNGFPAHCVDRTHGQKKLPFTLMPRRIVLHGDNTLDLPHEPLRRYQQVIFTKRNQDFLSNPKADRLINATLSRYMIVFGVLAEQCVKSAALAFLARRRHVAVVTDACGFWCASDAELAFRQMAAKGAVLVTAEDLLSGVVDKKFNSLIPETPEVEEEASQLSRKPMNGRGNGKSRYTQPDTTSTGKKPNERSTDRHADIVPPFPQKQRTRAASHRSPKTHRGSA